MPQNEYLEPFVYAYRATDNPKHMGKDTPGLESRATVLEAGAVYEMANAVRDALEFGMPKWGADKLVSKMLVEGRDDAGANRFDTNNPRAKALFDKMQRAGHNQAASTYAAAALDTTEKAKRTRVDPYHIWNGLGVSKETGRSGQQHADRSNASEYAASHPKNAPFADFVNRAISGELTPREHLFQNISKLEDKNITTGGKPADFDRLAYSFDNKDPAEEAIVKAIAGVSKRHVDEVNYMVDRLAKDRYRKQAGIEQAPRAQLSADQLQLMDILASNPTMDKMLARMLGELGDVKK